MVEKWPRVESWIKTAENKTVLAEALLTRCFRTGEYVSTDGAGCDCPTHRAYRADEAEKAADVRLKHEMQAVHELSITQDTLREMTVREQEALKAKVAAEEARDRAVAAQSEAAGRASAAAGELQKARQHAANVEAKFAEFKDQEVYLKSVLAKIEVAKKALA